MDTITIPSLKPKINIKVTPPNLGKDIVLRPHQKPWAEKVEKILLGYHGYVDTSNLGSGKTFIGLHIAKKFNMPILVICTVSVVSVWEKACLEYGVKMIDVITYQSLRSISGKQPKHGLLKRIDTYTEVGNVHHVSFITTELYDTIYNNGVLVICDEFMNIKNNSDQYKACAALIHPIILTGGRSRFGLLSGSPIDKEEQAVNMLKLIGYIRSAKLYDTDRDTKIFKLVGAQELINACNEIDPEATNRVLSEIPPIKKNINKMVYTLYVEVIKKVISGGMASPSNAQSVFDAKNGFYNMTQDRAKELKAAINDLASAVNFDEDTGTAAVTGNNLGRITLALMAIEKAKIDDFARIATNTLEADPKNKVIVCVNYTNSLEQIKNIMILYEPLILNGSVPGPKRSGIVDLFNNDPNHRLLIMNTAVAPGLSMHDVVGNSPRFMYISPSYKMLDIYQASGRIHRDGSLSDATVRIFYGNLDNSKLETQILDAMARKTAVTKGVLDDAVKNQIVLPGDYQREVEK